MFGFLNVKNKRVLTTLCDSIFIILIIGNSKSNGSAVGPVGELGVGVYLFLWGLT